MQIEDILKSITNELDFSDGEFEGEAVVLNKPFADSNKGKALAVYAQNSVGDIVRVRFLNESDLDSINDEQFKNTLAERNRCDIQRDKSTPSFWMCRVIGATSESFMDHNFATTAYVDFKAKTVKSVRDGKQEYLGVELGLEPHDKIFSVYRSPETISAIAGKLESLPVIEDHIDPALTPDSSTVVARVGTTDIVEYCDESIGSTLFLRNSLNISNKVLKLLERGKKQLSLGYLAKTKPHDEYDFEQYDITPTHLAIVDSARGGAILSFEDKQKTKTEGEMKITFKDEDGTLSLQKVADMSTELQGALKDAPLAELVKVFPILEDLILKARENDPATAEAEATAMKEAEEGEAEKTEDMEAEKVEDMDAEKEPVKTEDMEAEESKEEEKSYSDADFVNAVNSAVSQKLEVVEKAKQFLDADYKFADASIEQIMKDTLAKGTTQTFADSEISVAFKLLEKPTSTKYKTFADAELSPWDKIADKEL